MLLSKKNTIEMPNKLLMALGVVGAVILSGCATTAADCDPSITDPSFIQKLNCDLGGGYADSVKQNEQRLVAAQEENRMFRDIYDQINLQRQQSDASLSVQKQRNQQLSNSLANLLNQLKSKHGNQSDVQKQIADIESSRQVIQAEPSNNSAQVAQKQAELQKLQGQLQSLQLSLGY